MPQIARRLQCGLFGPHGPRYRHPPPALVGEVRRLAGISSVQITFFADKDPARHSMPPGGFRLAIVNAWDLAAGMAGRDMLRAHFLGQEAPVDVVPAQAGTYSR